MAAEKSTNRGCIVVTSERVPMLERTGEFVVARVVEAILMAHHIEHDADVLRAVLATLENSTRFGDDESMRLHWVIQSLTCYARGNRDFINLMNCAARIVHATARD
jgi:hypothetical protein